ncbi:MAG: RNA pseudouridine synthase, partial [Candidatus Omnitrophica bacterium]|nr:RNA pseudouridine synthase [Candidatus Omnitrophota bacterium]
MRSHSSVSRKIPRKYQPKGFEIVHEDDHIIVGYKSAGILTVAAPYERERTVHQYLNEYVRKGNSRSRHVVFVVHRLDRETSGVLIFAKDPRAQEFLKDHWKVTHKIYYAVVHGRMAKKAGTISSYLVEDDKYRMHSMDEGGDGKLS